MNDHATSMQASGAHMDAALFPLELMMMMITPHLFQPRQG
jgi:hypothetical protein